MMAEQKNYILDTNVLLEDHLSLVKQRNGNENSVFMPYHVLLKLNKIKIYKEFVPFKSEAEYFTGFTASDDEEVFEWRRRSRCRWAAPILCPFDGPGGRAGVLFSLLISKPSLLPNLHL